MRHTDMQLDDRQITGYEGQRVRHKATEHDASKQRCKASKQSLRAENLVKAMGSKTGLPCNVKSNSDLGKQVFHTHTHTPLCGEATWLLLL